MGGNGGNGMVGLGGWVLGINGGRDCLMGVVGVGEDRGVGGWEGR